MLPAIIVAARLLGVIPAAVTPGIKALQVAAVGQLSVMPLPSSNSGYGEFASVLSAREYCRNTLTLSVTSYDSLEKTLARLSCVSSTPARSVRSLVEYHCPPCVQGSF